jgi:hypothetical protein
MATTRIFYNFGVPACAVRVRVLTPACGSPSVAAVQHPDAATVLANMRAGYRQSLVGTVKDLTPQMERHFREADVIILGERPYAEWPTFTPLRLSYGETMGVMSWRELGLPEHPQEMAMQDAYIAYQAWKLFEVFPETACTANEVVSRDFGRKFGLELVNARSTQEVDHLAYLLALLPEKVLTSGVFRKIDLNGEKSGVDKHGKFADRTLSIHNPYYIWDRHFFTQVLLRKLGHVVFAALDTEARQSIFELFDREKLPHASIPETFSHNFARFAIEGSWAGQPLNLNRPDQILRFKAK